VTLPYDQLIERLAEHEARPYAIRMGRRDWSDLRRDPRTLGQMANSPGDGLTFMGVAVRVEKARFGGVPQVFSFQIYATAQDLHDAIYAK
jgi:hypothetical protein